ncbi:MULTISPECIES: ferritin-like domain-containing protein [unclassified Paenibacillus]|uniref:ferritin-like domain-containing protein n=1 Tax=unclassified Paenibacillus TaxID=185978 RepID=UPI001AE0F7BF|nr:MULTISPECIES: ferritin-like domain-containing protein [unclassified Paenibacillus]MBP1154524.1 rubrerythrin [Paenibacillus sp. PvP091]MBP1170092.1 rubrerythrin [Paenibacillus sp. PvR098]MBP2441120.1 rubrerythrin [Paenibacillus sp. PvP052]
MFLNDYHYRSESDIRFIQDIHQAINGEYSAMACYEQLAKLAPSEEEQQRILEIRKDEMKHFYVFSQIYTSLTGKQPNPQITESCPTEYSSGLQAALKDEQETVDFYLEISDKTTNPYIHNQFRRAAADEQNHAVWFLYFYTKRCCHQK